MTIQGRRCYTSYDYIFRDAGDGQLSAAAENGHIEAVEMLETPAVKSPAGLLPERIRQRRSLPDLDA
jgi:hypothetical protein